MYSLAETHVVCDVTTTSPFLSCQVYIPSIIHIIKIIYLNLYSLNALCKSFWIKVSAKCIHVNVNVFTLWVGRGTV